MVADRFYSGISKGFDGISGIGIMITVYHSNSVTLAIFNMTPIGLLHDDFHDKQRGFNWVQWRFCGMEFNEVYMRIYMNWGGKNCSILINSIQ